MARRKAKPFSLGELLRNSSLLETAVRMQLPCGMIEYEGETIDLAPYHVHSLGVWLSAAAHGPSIDLEFCLPDEVTKANFPCEKLEGPLKAFVGGEVEFGGDYGTLRFFKEGLPDDVDPLLRPRLYTIERTFRAGEVENRNKAIARLQELEKPTMHNVKVLVSWEDLSRALTGETVHRLPSQNDDQRAYWIQRREVEHGTELFLMRVPTPRAGKNGKVYTRSTYWLAGGAIVRLTAPVVESIQLLVGGLAEDERLKDLLRDLYGT